MTSIFLSCYNLPVIKQVAWVLGQVMNLLYEIFSSFGILNIGLCIIVFTIIIKMILLPMTIKQQKFTRVSSVMNPEIQAIRKKYANKRDQESVAKMNQELAGVYEKYGTSPSGGCLQLFIQMPIILALYAVISHMTAYVPDIDVMFKNVTENVVISSEVFYDINKVDGIVNDSKKQDIDEFLDDYYAGKDDKINADETNDNVYTGFTDITTSKSDLWDQIYSSYDDADEIIDRLSTVTAEEWATVLEDNKSDLVEKYSKFTETEWSDLKNTLNKSKADLEDQQDTIKSVYNFFGIDLSISPGAGVWWALFIPVLSALSQWVSMKISQSNQNQSTEPSAVGSSMKAMTYTMPVMSAVFCYSLPAGLGLYWVISAVVQALQQLVINNHLKGMNVDEIIKENVKKVNKKREKKGLPEKRISTAASSNVKNIDKIEERPVKKEKKGGSISSKANLGDKYKNNN